MDVPERLSLMPALLAEVVAGVPGSLVRVRSGPFALVEQVWHLADLEREGFGERIRRLIAEEDPFLPDFDGAHLAEIAVLLADLVPAHPLIPRLRALAAGGPPSSKAA